MAGVTAREPLGAGSRVCDAGSPMTEGAPCRPTPALAATDTKDPGASDTAAASLRERPLSLVVGRPREQSTGIGTRESKAQATAQTTDTLAASLEETKSLGEAKSVETQARKAVASLDAAALARHVLDALDHKDSGGKDTGWAATLLGKRRVLLCVYNTWQDLADSLSDSTKGERRCYTWSLADLHSHWAQAPFVSCDLASETLYVGLGMAREESYCLGAPESRKRPRRHVQLSSLGEAKAAETGHSEHPFAALFQETDPADVADHGGATHSAEEPAALAAAEAEELCRSAGPAGHVGPGMVQGVSHIHQDGDGVWLITEGRPEVLRVVACQFRKDPVPLASRDSVTLAALTLSGAQLSAELAKLLDSEPLDLHALYACLCHHYWAADLVATPDPDSLLRRATPCPEARARVTQLHWLDRQLTVHVQEGPVSAVHTFIRTVSRCPGPQAPEAAATSSPAASASSLGTSASSTGLSPHCVLLYTESLAAPLVLWVPGP